MNETVNHQIRMQRRGNLNFLTDVDFFNCSNLFKCMTRPTSGSLTLDRIHCVFIYLFTHNSYTDSFILNVRLIVQNYSIQYNSFTNFCKYSSVSIDSLSPDIFRRNHGQLFYYICISFPCFYIDVYKLEMKQDYQTSDMIYTSNMSQGRSALPLVYKKTLI